MIILHEQKESQTRWKMIRLIQVLWSSPTMPVYTRNVHQVKKGDLHLVKQ